MPNNILTRVRNAWNVFAHDDPINNFRDYGSASYRNPDRVRVTGGNEKTIVTAVYNRIAMDVAAIDFRHVKLDENHRYIEEVNSQLNSCLSLEANIDQSSRAFIHDAVLTMFDAGTVALVPVDTTADPDSSAYDIETMRVGRITQWYPSHVEVDLYNDRTGQHEKVKMEKTHVAIVTNPFYSVMNEPNAVGRRLARKLALIDAVDERNSSGKLDMVIQLPYVVKTDMKRQQAEDRRKMIEDQLVGSKYGIAYIDGTERITQLNRPVENNLLNQIEMLTGQFFSQLSMTQAIMDGSAPEEAMLNYYTRCVGFIAEALKLAMLRTFLTKTARTQGQSIEYFRDPFKLVPVSQIAEIADKFTRNEIMTSNEIRQIVGFKPSKDPHADELRNKNLSAPAGEDKAVPEAADQIKEESQNGET